MNIEQIELANHIVAKLEHIYGCVFVKKSPINSIACDYFKWAALSVGCEREPSLWNVAANSLALMRLAQEHPDQWDPKCPSEVCLSQNTKDAIFNAIAIAGLRAHGLKTRESVLQI
jgi:hypothetical protein